MEDVLLCGLDVSHEPSAKLTLRSTRWESQDPRLESELSVKQSDEAHRLL